MTMKRDALHLVLCTCRYILDAAAQSYDGEDYGAADTLLGVLGKVAAYEPEYDDEDAPAVQRPLLCMEKGCTDNRVGGTPFCAFHLEHEHAPPADRGPSPAAVRAHKRRRTRAAKAAAISLAPVEPPTTQSQPSLGFDEDDDA